MSASIAAVSAFGEGARRGASARRLALALVLTAIVGGIDYLTGYDVPFDSLYLFPVALAAWSAGRPAGFAFAGAAMSCWLLSFSASHSHARPLLFYWEAVVLLGTLLAFAEAITRLRFALERAEERFVRVLEEIQAAAFVVDPGSGQVLYANQRLAQMFGTGSEAPSARVPAWCLQRGDVAPAGHDGRAVDAAPGSDFRIEERRDPVTGRWYLVQAGAIPWSGRRSAGLRVLTDITDRRQAQALRRKHEELLRRTARLSALAETTSALAHEINQPLTAITSYCDACLRFLQSDSPNRGELAPAIEKARAQAIRASGILRRMRDFVRSKQTRPTSCDIDEIVTESVEILETRIADEGVCVECKLEPGLPPIRADRFLLVQVVVNLVDNAIDAVRTCEPARRRVVVATSAATDGGVQVSVADCGDGIPPAVAERLYVPFTSSKELGLGLGLSICRSVAEAHGGRLWHVGRGEGGTVFHFVVTGAA